MSDGELNLYLELYADIARIESGVGELAGQLRVLAQDPVLRQQAHHGSEGIDHLATTLVTMELDLAGARSQVTDAVVERRRDLPGVAAMLDLYRDVTRAEFDVTKLAETLQQAAGHRLLHESADVAHLAGVLADVRQRLERDRGILLLIEQTLEQLLTNE